MKGSPRKDCKQGPDVGEAVARLASMKGSPRKDCKTCSSVTPSSVTRPQ